MAAHAGLVLATAALYGMGAGVTYHTTRPGCVCGLPCYDYVHGGASQPVSVFSLDAVPLVGTPPPVGGTAAAAGERVKYFQLSQTTMQLDHCFLSRVVLVLSDTGEWTLSLRADQNPWMTGPGNVSSTPVQLPGGATALRPPIPDLTKETEGLKRNLFFLTVRCYGGYTVREQQPALAPGKPVLFRLQPAPFWVQRGQPYDFWDREATPDVARYFDQIDRVEVEFSYR